MIYNNNMNCRARCREILLLVLTSLASLAAPVIAPLPAVTIPAGKSLIVPITATSASGHPLTYTITSSTNAFAVVMHTNNPFWQLTVAQTATNTAPGAYQTPYRGGLVTVTNVGTLTFELFPEYAPHTVNVFQGLTTSGFYNSNTIFHRVVSDFVIQGGDPGTNGTGGLVFQYNDEFSPQAIFSGNGQLALANSGPNTDGSQFFVTVGQQRFLDFTYTLFGQLVRGFNVLTNINSTAVDTNSFPLAREIIQTAAYVTNTTDTVVTLCATNLPGVKGTITVIADDGQGGRTTNTFAATTVTDASSNGQPLFYPINQTNLVGPLNTSLTNYLNAIELDGNQIYWDASFVDYNSYTNGINSAYYEFPSSLQSLTYNVTNADGQLQLAVVPSTNYAGPINIFLYASSSASFNPYAELEFSVVIGDTAIAGQTNPVTVRVAAPFTNALLATFTNGVPGSAAANFTASINWGDNTTNAAVVTANAAGIKSVWGAHAYTWPGHYPVYVTVQSAIGATTTLLSSVNAISTAPRLTVTASPALTRNGFTFNLQPTAGLNGLIQVSTNLATWSTLANFIGTNITLNFLDPAATNGSRRFYRAVIP